MVIGQVPGPSQKNPAQQSTDEYELVPRNQLEYLQREVEKLRKNPFGDTGSAKDMLGQIDALNRNMARLIAIFESANDEIVRDYKDQANTQKIAMVLEQNEKLAKGIVAIADLLRELKTMRAEPWPQQAPAGALHEPSSASSWQSAIPPEASAQQLNPFLAQQGYPDGVQQSSPPQYGASPPNGSQPAAQRRLPPIDFSAVPPPPRR